MYCSWHHQAAFICTLCTVLPLHCGFLPQSSPVGIQISIISFVSLVGIGSDNCLTFIFGEILSYTATSSKKHIPPMGERGCSSEAARAVVSLSVSTLLESASGQLLYFFFHWEVLSNAEELPLETQTACSCNFSSNIKTKNPWQIKVGSHTLLKAEMHYEEMLLCIYLSKNSTLHILLLETQSGLQKRKSNDHTYNKQKTNWSRK